MKRKPTKQESIYIDAAVSQGCIICGEPAQFHHLPGARPNALAIGFCLCPDHHTGAEYPGQSIHSSRLLFTQKYGSELELFQKSMLQIFEHSIPF